MVTSGVITDLAASGIAGLALIALAEKLIPIVPSWPIPKRSL